jgi:hypothetical protein
MAARLRPAVPPHLVGGAGYEVEFVTFTGETVGVVSLTPEQVRSTGHRELPHARAIA